MTNYSNYRLPIPEANLLASLIGIEQDLCGVISYCDFLLGNTEIMRLNPLVREAVSVAAVIRYARCFLKGVRGNLENNLLDGNEELSQDHNYFILLRNKHFAHSVNPFEENEVTVQIADHFTLAQEITTINSFHKRVLGLSLADTALLKRLAEAVLDNVKATMKQEKIRLLPLVKARQLEELKSYGLECAPKTEQI